MIVDSSALVAIMRREPEADSFSEAILAADTPMMSAASYLESGIVIDRSRNPQASADFDRVIDALSLSIAPVTASQARLAREAYRRYGKGTGHPAGLNFGDCFSYALAIEAGKPLLFKGNDFTQTDLADAANQSF
ncbi:MAG: type II toxin-antitoxin system VapC family toxin [Sphingomonadales bacterium]|nr:type II toxin-antitoxin system VapC family toxin [Sphingomonadales bacterium]